MTREEQKMIQLVRESDVIDLTDGSELATASRYLFDVAIKALEQEPCEDCVSREEVLDLCNSKDPEYKVSHLKEDVECLPSVTPTCKKGKWIKGKWINSHDTSFYNCSNCGVFWDKGTVDNCNFFYCPHCGTKMIGGEE